MPKPKMTPKMPTLAKLMQDNRERQRSFRAEVSADEATIYIYDVIGFDFWSGGGVIAKDFAAELDKITASTVHLRINSPGGDVFEARAMVTAMKRHSANFIAHVDGVAASAASFLAVNADEVEMAPGSMFMIHNAWTITLGDKGDMLAAAQLLEKVDGTIADDYAKRTGMDKAAIADLMDAETWFTAEEAVEAKMADRIAEEPVKTNARWNLSAYQNAPKPKEPDTEIDDSHIRAALERRLSLIEKIT